MADTATNREALLSKQQELGERFIRRSLADARHILDNLQLDACDNAQVMADLCSLAHRLAGTAATLGFHDLSAHALELEMQLLALSTSETHSAFIALQSVAARVLNEIVELARARAIG